jgi:hypothetical protein
MIMPGRGTGIDIYFACPRYKALDWRTCTQRDNAWHSIKLTGRTKPNKNTTNLHPRTSTVSREYRCQCGHVGWSTHKDLERMENTQCA